MTSQRRAVKALRVDQWLSEWDSVPFGREGQPPEPPHQFYMFAMDANTLRRLSGIYRRTPKPGELRSTDPNVQRRHETDRSTQIAEFVRYGYPWSDLNATRRESGKFDDLRKPGWLPTAIVLNVVDVGESRNGRRMLEEDAVTVDQEGSGDVVLPAAFDDRWTPRSIHPFEVIDGQHRLWAFGEHELSGDFQLPVVAFVGLDRRWQAYLFWTINITPKRINPSLAFDLYPLLRAEDWLDRFEGHPVYRESRAQELTEALWAHPESPWYQRINMLGEGRKGVSQAAFVRSLLATFVRSWPPNERLGGLFGASRGTDVTVLPWSRAQQAAFLILVWSELRKAIKGTKAAWAKEVRRVQADVAMDDRPSDAAFDGDLSLLDSDQGVRAFLHITNDIFYVRADSLELFAWQSDARDEPATDLAGVTKALSELIGTQIAVLAAELCESLAWYDWRTFSAPGLTEEEQVRKASFRGAGGYRQLRQHLLTHLQNSTSQTVATAARDVADRLRG